MEPMVRKFDSFEEADRADDEYYVSLSPQARLDILLELVGREQVGDIGRLKRVCRIIPLRES